MHAGKVFVSIINVIGGKFSQGNFPSHYSDGKHLTVSNSVNDIYVIITIGRCWRRHLNHQGWVLSADMRDDVVADFFIQYMPRSLYIGSIWIEISWIISSIVRSKVITPRYLASRIMLTSLQRLSVDSLIEIPIELDIVHVDEFGLTTKTLNRLQFTNASAGEDKTIRATDSSKVFALVQIIVLLTKFTSVLCGFIIYLKLK